MDERMYALRGALACTDEGLAQPEETLEWWLDFQVDRVPPRLRTHEAEDMLVEFLLLTMGTDRCRVMSAIGHVLGELVRQQEFVNALLLGDTTQVPAQRGGTA